MEDLRRPLVLLVLDGFGLRADSHDNAIALARAPRWAALWATAPHTQLSASGPDVGLPPGQFGNSEVGHLNLGAGRIAQMDISRIDCAVAEGTLARTPVIAAAIAHAKARQGRLHLLGLLSDGGVHSSMEHMLALVDAAASARVEVVIHAFLDGRDTPPKSAGVYLERLQAHLRGKGAIGTVSGRYYAMDRDKRWERVELAYRALVQGEGPRAPTASLALEASYAKGVTDEFLVPVVLDGYVGIAADGRDAAIFTNFRADRAREITAALTDSDFQMFPRERSSPFGNFVAMTAYDAKLSVPVAFPKEVLPDLFGEIVARHGLHQLRAAETEKFAHVTYFFNGGVEPPFEGEERVLVPSPRDVPTYDKKPEMSAAAVTRAVVDALASDRFGFVLVNLANPDMVGHTGVLDAAIHAIEAVDQSIGAIQDAVQARRGTLIVTADHGNCELMRDPVTGAPHTAHTTNPVPFVLLDTAHPEHALREGGRLCDVAPTMLQLMGLPKPAAMTGETLLK